MVSNQVELALWTHRDVPFCVLLTAGWLKAVQVLMVLSLILCCLSFILFMFQLYTMRRGGLFYATGLCQLCTSEHCPSPPLIPQELSRREVGCVKMLVALRMGLSQKKTIFNTPRATRGASVGYLSAPRDCWDL